MKKKKMVSLVATGAICIIVAVTCFLACSSDEYLDVIPKESSAIVSLDIAKTMKGNSGTTEPGIIKALFGDIKVEQCGIDFSKKLYLFASPDGSLGIAGKVDSKQRVKDMLEELASTGKASKPKTHRKMLFSVIKQSWIVGVSDNSCLIMGPTLPSSQPDMMRKMVKYLNGQNKGISDSRLFAKLDSIDSPIAMAARVSALPDKIMPLLMIGTPKGTEPSDVILAAGLKRAGDCLVIDATTSSFLNDLNKKIETSKSVLRKIEGKYTASVPSTAAFCVQMNAEGKALLSLLKDNKALQAVLAGINTAIDMDNIIRSIDGDVCLTLLNYGERNKELQMSAKLANSDFLKDIDYWKKSCPQGGSITDIGINTYCYKDASLTYCFGVSNDLQFFSGSSLDNAKASVTNTQDAIPSNVRDCIVKGKIGISMYLPALLGNTGISQTVNSILSPLFGEEIKYIVISME